MDLDELPSPDFEGTVGVDELEVDGDNPNEQSDEMFGLLCENMRQKGWIGNAIVADTDGLIADGEHRWRAAQEIGLEEVPVKMYDIDDADRRLWRQELNKISGDHDTKRDALEYDLLLNSGKSDDVNDLVQATGEDLDELLAEIRVDNSLPPAYEYDPEHNIHFEDCVTGMADRLDDDSVDCVITDPPYGVDVDISDSMGRVKETQHAGTVANDKDEGEALALWDSVMEEIARTLTDEGHLYVFASWKTWSGFCDVIEKYGFEVRNCLVWIKSDASQIAAFGGGAGPKYAYKHEFCIFATREDARPIRGYPEDVLEYTEARWSDVTDQETQHPTQKPVNLISELVQNSTSKEDTILDPFMGSGTTAVAAIQNDRDYVGFELDEENYRRVIERRIGETKRQAQAAAGDT